MSGRRRITPEAGRALEILGHAIEYLTDEFVHEGKGLEQDIGRVEAIQRLMALNRQIYFDCPVIPGFGERFLIAIRHAFHVQEHHSASLRPRNGPTH